MNVRPFYILLWWGGKFCMISQLHAVNKAPLFYSLAPATCLNISLPSISKCATICPNREEWRAESGEGEDWCSL